MSAEPAGVIHDIGYQRYVGPRLGRAYAARSLYVHALRASFGLGRSAKAKIFPWIVVGIVMLVATIVTAIRSQSGEVVLSYVAFPATISFSFVPILFCAVVAPELVSRDLRTGVLPLYFSRPLTRSDYVLAKLAALISAVWLLFAAPLLLMFVGGVFTVSGPSEIWHEVVNFGAGLTAAGIYAVTFGALSLLVASLASRRAVSAAAIVALFLVTTPVFGVLTGLGSSKVQQLAGLVSPMTLVDGVATWLFPPISGAEVPYPGTYGPLYAAVAAGLVAICTLLLLLRYRKVAS